MAKFYSRSIVRVSTFHEDGSRWGARTSELGRLFRPRRYECGYHSSGEPEVAYEEVRITRDTWWRW